MMSPDNQSSNNLNDFNSKWQGATRNPAMLIVDCIDNHVTRQSRL